VWRVSDQRPTSAPSGGPSYAGQRLGLPEEGSGSVAGWNRRVLAHALDSVASKLVAALFVGTGVWQSSAGLSQWASMLVFIAEATVLTPLIGGSFGQALLRVAVVRLDGRPLNLLQALLRTVLVCLVIPPLVFNRDQRGLHDLAVGTVTVAR
jgi:uncharacterized RDD family membrane protein YckC